MDNMNINNNQFNITNNNQYNSYVTSRETRVAERNNTDNTVTPDRGTSVNEYGDNFVRSSIINNEDGAVYSKPRSDEVSSARVPAEEELPKIDSLVGYTTSQVQQFYNEGRISRYDYEVKMEQKQEMLELIESENDSEETQGAVITSQDNEAADAAVSVTTNEARAETAKADGRKAESEQTYEEERRSLNADTKAYLYDSTVTSKNKTSITTKKGAYTSNTKING